MASASAHARAESTEAFGIVTTVQRRARQGPGGAWAFGGWRGQGGVTVRVSVAEATLVQGRLTGRVARDGGCRAVHHAQAAVCVVGHEREPGVDPYVVLGAPAEQGRDRVTAVSRHAVTGESAKLGSVGAAGSRKSVW